MKVIDPIYHSTRKHLINPHTSSNFEILCIVQIDLGATIITTICITMRPQQGEFQPGVKFYQEHVEIYQLVYQILSRKSTCVIPIRHLPDKVTEINYFFCPI